MPKKVGRKSKVDEWLTDERLSLLQGWKMHGLTDEQIAKNIGISAKTLYDWINKHSNIRNSLKMGKEAADIQVENALFKSACGYDYEEITEELKWNPNKRIYEMKVTKKVKKHIPPSNTAQIFWLKNRKADAWRDRVENQITLNEDTDALSKAFEELMGNDNSIQYETITDSGISEN